MHSSKCIVRMERTRLRGAGTPAGGPGPLKSPLDLHTPASSPLRGPQGRMLASTTGQRLLSPAIIKISKVQKDFTAQKLKTTEAGSPRGSGRKMAVS